MITSRKVFPTAVKTVALKSAIHASVHKKSDSSATLERLQVRLVPSSAKEDSGLQELLTMLISRSLAAKGPTIPGITQRLRGG